MPSIPRTIGAVNRGSHSRAPDTRLNATDRGYTSRWRKYARVYIAQHPLCVHCLAKDRSTLATLVDHIIPVSDSGEADPNFWRADNHQALCVRCHAKKTANDKRLGLTR